MRRTVLIVDDDRISIKLFERVLQSHGLETIVSIDGSDTMELARDHHPDLILMDICLPHISGIELTKMLKADSELSNIPVLAVTANAMKHDKEDILEAGCDGYISKPVFILDFITEIKANLNLGKFRIINSLKTGHKQIDYEHEQIMSLLNEFDSFQDEENDHFCETKLTELLEMMKKHIRTEEMIMDEHGYDGLATQKKEHANMIGTLEKLISSWNSESYASNFTEALTHIVIEDFFCGDLDFAQYYQAAN